MEFTSNRVRGMTSFHLPLIIVGISLVFDFTNGWHDAASPVATVASVAQASACALSPRPASNLQPPEPSSHD
jgi:hypothetical protein